MSTINSNHFVDITDVVCPVTFVKAKVALEEINNGQILEIKLHGGEPIQNVPRSLKNESHKVLSVNKNEDGTYTIVVEKGGLLEI
jgi:tRNA 2-thiouridine synthesizing protein A